MPHLLAIESSCDETSAAVLADGHILSNVISSQLEHREYGGVISYMSAKAAMIAASKHLALELAPHGVTVNSVAPGSILFPGGVWDRFQKTQSPETVQKFIEQNLPSGKFGGPEPIGDTVAFLASQNAWLITGTCINVDGGQSRSLI